MSQPKREQLLFVLRQTELARDIMAFAIDRQARGLSPRTCEYYSEELRHPLVYLDGRVVQGVHDTTADPVRGCVLHLSDLGRNSEGRSLAQAEF